MSRKNKISPELLHKREQELIIWCLEHEGEIEFDQFNKYHFRIFSKRGNKLDVWPIRQTYCIPGRTSRTYSSPNELLEYL